MKEKYNSLPAFAQATVLFIAGMIAFGLISIVTSVVVAGIYPEMPTDNITEQLNAYPIQYMLIHFMPFQIGFLLFPGIIYTQLIDSESYQSNKPQFKTIIWAFLLFVAAFFLLPFFSEINLEITKYLGAYETLMAEKVAADAQISKLVGEVNSVSYFTALVLIGIITGIAEEFAFRKFLFAHILNNTHKLGLSVISSAVIFSLLHFNYIQLLPLFAFGIVLALMYYVSGSLIPGIIMHASNNMLNIYWLANDNMPEWMDGMDLKITIPATILVLGLMVYRFGRK